MLQQMKKNSKGFKYVFMKFEQANLQKYITWPKKSSNGN